MDHYHILLEEKTKQFLELEEEYLDFKETSKLLEEELETRIDDLKKNNDTLQKANKKIKKEVETSKVESEKNFNKILEQGNSLISKENEIKQLKLRIVHLENYNEECMFQKRITENIINELEEKINNLLEKLALMQTEFDLNKTEACDQIHLLKDQLKNTEFQIHLLNFKNSKIFKTINMKEDSNSNTNSKIQLTQKFQSNNEINQNNKNQEFLGQNLKNILLTYNKINNPQKENISVPVIMNNKIKCHKSFHKGNEKNYSLNNETKPPLKFGIQANFKNLLKKIEPKSKLA